jgi:hypothetical protein
LTDIRGQISLQHPYFFLNIMADPTAAPKPTPLKRGSFVRVVREQLENSVEATASDTRLPSYLFETRGEILELEGDYALLKFGAVPTPNMWLRLDQLTAF